PLLLPFPTRLSSDLGPGPPDSSRSPLSAPSLPRHYHGRVNPRVGGRVGARHPGLILLDPSCSAWTNRHWRRHGHTGRGTRTAFRDRKSTRLNSSHGS